MANAKEEQGVTGKEEVGVSSSHSLLLIDRGFYLSCSLDGVLLDNHDHYKNNALQRYGIATARDPRWPNLLAS